MPFFFFDDDLVRITIDRVCEVNEKGIHQELMIPKDQDQDRRKGGREND